MSDYTKYTKQEMQAYAIAKSIKENQIVIVGTGLPLIAASLAKRAVCPSCHPIVESGLMDCDPVEVPRSVGDNRFMAHCAVQWPNIRFVGFEANEWLHDEDRLVAFIGGAQIDPYGNVNSTCIFGKGDYLQPTTRFTGSGGANGIATYCNTIIMMQHQKRRFMDHVDYITSCGWMDGPGGRERAGLPGNRGPQMVVTDLGIMKFDEETGGKRKLSKRKDPELSLDYYRKDGYHPRTMKVYLLTLLNSNFEEWYEKFPDKDINEFPFSIEKMSQSGALFDKDKLHNICKNELARLSEDEMYDFLHEWAVENEPEKAAIWFADREKMLAVLRLYMGIGMIRRRKDFI